MPKLNKGQSVVEYVLLVAGAIMVLVVFLNPNGPFKRTTEGILNSTADRIIDMTKSVEFNNL